jgi:UDP-N-acetylmuramoyl-tripeptide--D-alanyl-D-alanine ligase
MEPLCRIAQPDWGVITTIGPVHLEFFESVEAIAREKSGLLRLLPADGAAVLSLDDACYPVLREAVPCRLVTVSMRGAADYTLEAGDAPDTGLVTERATGEAVMLRLPAPGRHNRHNVLMAVAVARGFNVSWSAMAAGLRTYTPPPMRWETSTVRDVTVVNDAYNANPLGMRAALDTFRGMPVAGRKWLVLGDMLELGVRAVEEHEAVGRLVAAGDAAGLIAVGPLGARLADGAEAAGWTPECVLRCATAGEAGEALAARVRPGDAVLFKASRGVHLEDAVTGFRERLAGRTPVD